MSKNRLNSRASTFRMTHLILIEGQIRALNIIKETISVTKGRETPKIRYILLKEASMLPNLKFTIMLRKSYCPLHYFNTKTLSQEVLNLRKRCKWFRRSKNTSKRALMAKYMKGTQTRKNLQSASTIGVSTLVNFPSSYNRQPPGMTRGINCIWKPTKEM